MGIIFWISAMYCCLDAVLDISLKRSAMNLITSICQSCLRESRIIASHAGWAKSRQRRTQQNHTVRRVSLRSTHPTFELLEVPLIYLQRLNPLSPFKGERVRVRGRERRGLIVATLVVLAALPACTSVNTFPLM